MSERKKIGTAEVTVSIPLEDDRGYTAKDILNWETISGFSVIGGPRITLDPPPKSRAQEVTEKCTHLHESETSRIGLLWQDRKKQLWIEVPGLGDEIALKTMREFVDSIYTLGHDEGAKEERERDLGARLATIEKPTLTEVKYGQRLYTQAELDAAVKAEREACAMVANEQANSPHHADSRAGFTQGYARSGYLIEGLIRGRAINLEGGATCPKK